ncbi:MAG: HAMP domain-containing histidine kinase [Acetatifactor sp.]|nr:HAMP domain-containing histidine kinase [Acetatifactor sp.]
MIRKLRKKFILTAAGALFAVIVLVMAAVNCVFFFQTRGLLDSRLDQIINSGFQTFADSKQETPPNLPDGRPPDESLPPGQASPGQEPPESKGLFRLLPRLEDHLRLRPEGYLIRLDPQGAVTDILQKGPETYSQSELAHIASTLLEKKKDQGWHQYFRFRIVSGEDTGPICIALVNASSELYSILAMLLISSAMGALSFLLALLIIILASGRAVKPMAESYLRQRQFITDAGHELKTPLTVISADNELARMLFGDSEWFDGIDKQTARMSRLVQDMITLAKMEEEQRPVFSSFDLSEAVYDTAKSFEGLIRSRGKHLTLDIAPDIVCTGDESSLRRIVSILLDNAAKYCADEGTISVNLSARRQIRLQVVNDLRPGDTCDPGQMFDRFYRADKARASDGSCGLGLSIARSLAQPHKGTLRARIQDDRTILLELKLPAPPSRTLL